MAKNYKCEHAYITPSFWSKIGKKWTFFTNCKIISSSQKDEFERILSIHLNNGWKIEGEFEHTGNSFSQSIIIEINYYHHARFYESGELEELGYYDKDTIKNDDIELFDNGKIMHKYSDGKSSQRTFLKISETVSNYV